MERQAQSVECRARSVERQARLVQRRARSVECWPDRWSVRPDQCSVGPDCRARQNHLVGPAYPQSGSICTTPIYNNENIVKFTGFFVLNYFILYKLANYSAKYIYNINNPGIFKNCLKKDSSPLFKVDFRVKVECKTTLLDNAVNIVRKL